ncbi:uncharacterized protein LOC133529703 [Cydia pomonella]|uniref:uncharacterized protein LOC133529703 n=1 Tax=Cydia pomonella TaxID=82600 RepID=UPI002ADD5590|nr:uncharacterized protein LOC133529703 [Cydia pomonella]
MAVSAQRDLVSLMKTETFLNVSIISKLHPLPSDLKQLFNKDTLEKLTQLVFNPLSYYLVSIVDPGKASSFSWPLYDTKTEKAYRNQLSSFIADYSSKGLLSPVMSSYLVNPACYKVTLFMFQLSQLAVQGMLKSMMKTEEQKKLYAEVTERYKSQNQEGIAQGIEKENKVVLLKLSNYLQKRKNYERIAELFRNGITSMEDKLTKLKPKEKVASLVDSFVKDNSLDEETKVSILEIKNFNKPARYFSKWLEDIDSELVNLETEWNTKMSPIVNSASKTKELSKELIERQTGEADKNSFTLEYNPNTDEISTKVLEEKVNSQQKYILKNIVKNDRLSFPNLIRGYIVAVSYILKNKQIGDEIVRFNKYLEQSNMSYLEMVEAMRVLTERLRNAETRLEPAPLSFNQSISIKDINEIPPLLDLSDLSMKKDNNAYLDMFTPLGATKHHFNLRRTNTTSFVKPQNRSLIYQAPRDDFLKNFITGPYDRQNSTTNMHNLSIISQVQARSNETIAECSAGFTKQQIQRLLSTHKKSSSTKKHKFKLDRPSMIIKKGGLFNASSTSKAGFNISNTSSENGLFRCHSSPNLFENKENKYAKRIRKLSIMQEGSPSLLEVSGIMALEEKNTPKREKLPIINSLNYPIPTIVITPAKANIIDNLNDNINNIEKNSIESGIASMCSKNSIDNDNHTPKSRIPVPIKQTSSIEKIINRFKKVRANVIAQEAKEDEIKTIYEEKENCNAVNVDVFTANKILLPDLLSPSWSVPSMKGSDFLEVCDDLEKTEGGRPRESLGKALGVDKTFLDQFDLID